MYDRDQIVDRPVASAPPYELAANALIEPLLVRGGNDGEGGELDKASEARSYGG